MFVGGKMLVKELQPRSDGIDLRGTVFECTILAPQGDITSSFDVSAGAIIITSTAEGGFWRPNDSKFMNLPDGSTATLTVPFSVSDTYDKFFKNGKVRYAGEVVTQEDFENEEKWTVTAVTDTKTSVKRTIKIAGAPVLSVPELALSAVSDTTVEVVVPFVSEGQPLTSAVLKFGSDIGSLNGSVELTGACTSL